MRLPTITSTCVIKLRTKVLFRHFVAGSYKRSGIRRQAETLRDVVKAPLRRHTSPPAPRLATAPCAVPPAAFDWALSCRRVCSLPERICGMPFLRERSGRWSPVKIVAFTAAILPALWIAYQAITDDLGARPVTEAIHQA